MTKMSFSFVVRKKDTAGSYRINSGPLWGGDAGRLGIRVEGFRNRKEFQTHYQGKACKIEVCEVHGRARRTSTKARNRASVVSDYMWSKEGTLATFEVKIYEKAAGEYYFMRGESDLKRKDVPADKYANWLPSPSELTEKWKHYYQEVWIRPSSVKPGQPWYAKPERGRWQSVEINFHKYKRDFHVYGAGKGWMPNWKPPHFYLDFNVDKDSFERRTTVIIPEKMKRESRGRRGIKHHFYSIGFILEAPHGEKYYSKIVYLDCHNLLSHNCRVATEGFYNAHRERIEQRTVGATPGPGTHYGSEYFRGTLRPSQHQQYLKVTAKQHLLQYFGCMHYPLEVGRLGFARTFATPKPRRVGDRPRFDPVWAGCFRAMIRAKKKEKKGSTLIPVAKELIKAGWLGIYYNPDEKNSLSTALVDINYHKKTARTARRGSYKGIRVHDLVTNYCMRNTGREETAADKNKLDKLKKVNFGILITGDHDSGHCALFIKGNVYEVHWSRNEKDKEVFGARPLFQTPSNRWPWGSGIIVVPRGEW
jgi:hypothetical protein